MAGTKMFAGPRRKTGLFKSPSVWMTASWKMSQKMPAKCLPSPGEAQRSSSRMYSNFIRSWKRPYKNKNRGTSVVKRHVPFLFSVFVKAAVPEPPSPRRRERSKPECRALPKEKESMEWRNRNPLQKVPQPWLDLTNLAVTTGYHSLS